jgi:hypothetical protein
MQSSAKPSAAESPALVVVNPVAEAHADTEGAERYPPAARPSTLDGKTVALYWNG